MFGVKEKLFLVSPIFFDQGNISPLRLERFSLLLSLYRKESNAIGSNFRWSVFSTKTRFEVRRT
jgi:hypothetical protein